MPDGIKLSNIGLEPEEFLTRDGTFLYVVNNGVSKRVSIDDLIFDKIINNEKIDDSAVKEGNIDANAVTANKIKAGAIQTKHLNAGSITAEMLKVTGEGSISIGTFGGATNTDLLDALGRIGTLEGTVGGLEAASDGGINTFYQVDQPGSPALGDIWFDTDDNKLYRWNGSAWDQITDPDIATAIANAAAAANTADQKVTTYYSDEPPTVDLYDSTPLDALDNGDLWIDTNDNNKLYRFDFSTVSGTIGVGSGWILVSDSRIQTLTDDLAGALTRITSAEGTITTLQGTADGGIASYFQDDPPDTSAFTANNTGDLWMDTNDGNKLYRYNHTLNGDASSYNSTGFVNVQDASIQSAVAAAAAASNIADNKIFVYYSTAAPTVDNIDGQPLDSEDEGDLWINSLDKVIHRWSGSAWIPVADNRIGQTVNDLADAVTRLGTAETNITSLNSKADGFVHSFYQNDPPTDASVATGTLMPGDLWVDTNDGDRLYIYDETNGDNDPGWVLVQDPDLTAAFAAAKNAANTADRKISTYYQDDAPTHDSVTGDLLNVMDSGDLWFDTNNKNQLYRFIGDFTTEGTTQALNYSASFPVANQPYRIESLGGTSQDDWNTLFGTIGIIYKVGDGGTTIANAGTVSNGFADTTGTVIKTVGNWVINRDTTVEDNIYFGGTTLINGGVIRTGTVIADAIQANAITAEKIEAGAIDASHLNACSVTATAIAACAVTSSKIATGSIAAESMLAANIITAQSISSDAVITGSINSKNFDGSYNSETGLINAGTAGFFLEGNTGTIVANTLVARDDIITGDMIKFASGKALQSNEDGELEVVVDNETLSVQDGGLAIKSIPNTAVVIPTAAVTYSGAISDFDKGTFTPGASPGSSQQIIQVGDFMGIQSSQGAAASPSQYNGNATVFTIDLLDHFSSGSNLTSAQLYNIVIELDFTNITHLANTGDKMSNLYIQAHGSDSATALVNTSTSQQANFFQLKGPVFPNSKVEYVLNQVNIKPVLVATNRYIHVTLYSSIQLAQDYESSDSLGIKIKGTPDTRVLLEGTGTVSNTLRSSNDLFSSVTNNEWDQTSGPGYDDSVYE